ncbi:MAG: PDZ domain-containing protein, partial [Planctomycetota bacterium]
MLLNWLMFALAAVPTQAACLTDAPSGCNAQICIVRGTDQDCTAHVCVVRGEDETCTPHVITLREMGDGPALWHARAGAPGLVLGGPVTAQVFIAGDEGQEAKVWIGVRLTPVPAPLAAHLGKEGAMVANVVKASPADEAGLKQFDVIVRFGEQEIKAPTDLTEAVADAEAGQAVKVTLTREARRQTVELTPIERPKDLRWEMKYEEPEDAFADAAVKARGRMMQLGPDGRWIIKDLGPMPGFPLEFEHLYGLKDQLGGLEDLRDLDVRILRKLDPEAEGDAKIELRVKVDKDGETTVIETGPGDEITVARKGPDGRETTKTYKSAAELEEADPEAYELYSHHAEGRADVLRVVPRGPEGRELRRKFQVNVEKRVKEALERAR